MSHTQSRSLILAAKQRCRDLRRHSTRAERLFWEQVRDRKFLDLKFYRQYPFFFSVTDEETFAIVDFYCHERKLVVEIDGKIHDEQKEKDAARSDVLNAFGVSVVRFADEEVEKDMAAVFKKLETVLKGGNVEPRPTINDDHSPFSS